MMMSVAVAFAGDPTAPVADKLAQALTLYGETKFDEGIALAESCLKQEGVTSQDSIAIYEVLSIINYAKGEEFLKISVGYLDRIAKIGPCVIPLPHEIWPQELRDKWYQILRAKDALTCKPETSGGLKTIAIMEFDNFSTGKYQEQLGALSKGLADFFQHDFAKISALKVVERDKIDFVLKELELQKTGAVDPATAAKVGKILGAQIMVFGSVTQIEDNMSRMIVRAVNVETSEIIASVDKEGKPEYSKMEKELVKELAQALDITISDDVKEMIMEGGTESLDATAIYSKGLDYMDKYDYKNAYECFKKAYELDNTFAEAKRKMEIYRPLAG
jgi:TolB-like protein